MSTLEERIVKYHEDAERYELFDANLWWAPEYVDTFHPYTDWQVQLADMQAHGLNGGFVTAQTSRVDPWAGNEEVLEAISGTEGYYAAISRTALRTLLQVFCHWGEDSLLSLTVPSSEAPM